MYLCLSVYVLVSIAMWIRLRSAHSLYLFFSAWFILAGADRGIRHRHHHLILQVPHRTAHLCGFEPRIDTFPLYKHIFFDITKGPIANTWLFAMGPSYMKMIDTFFLFLMGTAMENHTTHDVRCPASQDEAV
ncbi:hypothetical protein F4861DRAFT_444960 [Xylaria intraflava]|nr:hypothetical protein F4861DRAFT_444960 [Xylaria intraflava]